MASNPVMSHPEIDLRPILYGLLPKATDNQQDLDMTTLEFVEVRGGQGTVRPRLTQKSFEEVWSAYQLPAAEEIQEARLKIIFVADPHFGMVFKLADNQYSLPAELNNTASWLHHNLAVPLSFFYYMDPHRDSRNLGTGCFLRFDESGNVIALDGFYHFTTSLTGTPTHVWYSHTLRAPHTSTYVIYNATDDAKKHITASARDHARYTIRPLAIDVFLADASIYSWDKEVSALRGKLLKYENNYPVEVVSASESSRAVAELHNLSQRLHVLREHLNDLRERLQFLFSVRQNYVTNLQFAVPTEELNSVTDSLYLVVSRTDKSTRWVGNYIERTGIRIALYFNLTTQSDSRTNLDIARLTTKIAVATQRDSSSMITIAAVTMFFLPGSFVSAFFSMVFFDKVTDDAGRVTLSVSSQWWIFPSVTIPLTVLVFVIWLVWRRRRISLEMQDIQLDSAPLTADLKPPKEKQISPFMAVPVVHPLSRSIDLPSLQRARSVGSINSALSL